MPQPVKCHVMSISPRQGRQHALAENRTAGAGVAYNMNRDGRLHQPPLRWAVGRGAGTPRRGRLVAPVAPKR